MNDPMPQPAAWPPEDVQVIAVELEEAVAKSGLMADGAASLKSAFAPHFQAFHDIAERAKGVAPTAPKAARAVRLELKAVRVAAEKTRKDLKADSLLRGKAIDGINAVLEYQLVPIEKALEDIEKAEERAEAARFKALSDTRSELLRPYADPTFYNLGGMPEADFQKLLAGAKAAVEAQAAAAAKAEADRIAAELAAEEARKQRIAEEAAERARMKAENERLAAQAAEERKQREAEQAEARKEQAKREAQATRERAEAAARERAIQEQASIEREKREAAEAALAAQHAEEERKQRAAAAAAKKAAAAPEKAKLIAYAEALRVLPVPALKDRALDARIREQVAKFSAWIIVEADKQGNAS